MRLTKWAHACVQIEVDEADLLIDPGAFTPNRAELLETASAVLITHEHFDHVDFEAVAGAVQQRPELRAVGPQSVVDGLVAAGAPAERLTAVARGDVLDVDGVEVRCTGEVHASIHDGIPVPYNVGFLVGGEVFHPGDSYRAPEFDVRTLLVPVSGPWTKIGEAIDFIRVIAPSRSIAVHEVMLSEIGIRSADRFLGADGPTGTPISMLAPGESIEL